MDGLGINDKVLNEIVDYIMKNQDSIADETTENVAYSGSIGAAKTLHPAMQSEKLARGFSKSPISYIAKYGKKAGPIGFASGVALDTYQGRTNAEKVFGKNPNIGQRAASVLSSVANGTTFGLFDFNNPEAIRNVYKFYGGKAQK